MNNMQEQLFINHLRSDEKNNYSFARYVELNYPPDFITPEEAEIVENEYNQKMGNHFNKM